MTNINLIKDETFLNGDFFKNLSFSTNDKNNKCYLNKKRAMSKDNDNDNDFINKDTTYITTINLNNNIVNNIENNNKEYDNRTLYVGCEDNSIKVIKLSNESLVKKFFY